MAALALLVTSTVFTLVPSNLFCKISKEGRSNAKFLTDWSEDAPQWYEGAGRAIDSVNAMQALTIDVNASINGIMNELQTIDLVLEKRVNPPLLTLKLGLQTKNTKLKIDQFIESHARDWTDWAKLGGIAAFQIGLDVVPLVKNVVKLQIEQYKFNKAAGPKAKVLKNKLIGKGSVWKRARATRLSKFGKFVKGANVIAAVVLAAVKVLDIIETCKKYKNAANDARQNKAELFAEWEEAKQSMKTVLGFVEQERKFFVDEIGTKVLTKIRNFAGDINLTPKQKGELTINSGVNTPSVLKSETRRIMEFLISIKTNLLDLGKVFDLLADIQFWAEEGDSIRRMLRAAPTVTQDRLLCFLYDVLGGATTYTDGRGRVTQLKNCNRGGRIIRYEVENENENENEKQLIRFDGDGQASNKSSSRSNVKVLVVIVIGVVGVILTMVTLLIRYVPKSILNKEEEEEEEQESELDITKHVKISADDGHDGYGAVTTLDLVSQ